MLNDINLPVLKNLIKNNYTPAEFFKSPTSNLVYVPMLKCASTYYSNMFRANKWKIISFDEIDWDLNFVFSFIMDPYRRHIKGLVEDLFWLKEKYNLNLEIFPDFFWELAPVLGIHSLGYNQVYEENCKKIFWIPLDIEKSSKEILDEIFKDHKVSWNWDFSVWNNPSNLDQLILFEKIYQLFDGPGKDWFNITHRADVLLYQQAVSNFVKSID